MYDQSKLRVNITKFAVCLQTIRIAKKMGRVNKVAGVICSPDVLQAARIA